MIGTKNGGRVFGFRGAVVVVCVLLIGVLVGSAVLVGCMDNTAPTLSKEEIVAKMSELGKADLGHRYVANHVQEFGIGGFDAGKLRNVEYYFTSLYVRDLPSVSEMAYTTAEFFMNYFYDRIDLNNREAVTNAIISCYVESTGDKYAIYRTPEVSASFTVMPLRFTIPMSGMLIVPSGEMV